MGRGAALGTRRYARIRRGIPAGVVLLAAVLGTAAPRSLAEEPGTQRPSEERLLTRGELQRRLDLVLAQLEDLLARLEVEDQPTPEEIESLKRLRREAADLQKRIEDTAPEAPHPEDDSWKARWGRFRAATEDVTRYDLDDGMLRFRLGIRLQLDETAVFESDRLEDEFGNISGGLNARRARVFAEGRILRRWDFNFTYDFGIDPGIKNAYLEGVGVMKWVHWRLGIFQEPFGLEKYTSSDYNAFLEWSLPIGTFTPGSNFGVMFRRSEVDQRLNWAISTTTKTNSGADNSSTSKYNFTGRITGTPIRKQDGQQLVHLGVGVSIRSPSGGVVRFKTRPEARFVTPFLDSGDLSANANSLLGFEFATVRGPWWAQYEWVGTQLDADSLSDPVFSGSYIEVGRFLTGESRPYDTTKGTFARVLPFRPYKKKGNPFKKDSNGGALEVTGRLSTTELNDDLVRAGKLDNLTLGMNWYLTPATCFMFNYIHSDIDHGGHADILLLRYQFNP